MKRPWVIKVGGELLNHPVHRKGLIKDLCRIARARPVVLIHGGGPQIAESLKKEKIPIRFVGGRRVTTSDTMRVVEKVLSGIVNKGLVADLVGKKVRGVGISGRDGGLVVGKLIPGLGWAGQVAKVNPALIRHMLKGGFMPVVSSVASDKNGNAVNINADDFASGMRWL